jgi:hypothetical protein
MHRVVGYIETMPDGKKKAFDKFSRPLGHYDPKRKVTLDNYSRIVANGDVLSSLIYKI